MNRINQKEAKIRLENAINLHEKMKKSYFWSPPSSASSRRSYEKYNSLEDTFNFILKNEKYEIYLSCETKCSCKNIYYAGYFKINGKSVTIRAIKTLYSKLIK